jgi:hypothetical protein
MIVYCELTMLCFSAGGMHYVQNSTDLTACAGSVVAELKVKAQQQKLRPQYSPQGARTCKFQIFPYTSQYSVAKYTPAELQYINIKYHHWTHSHASQI